MTERAKSTPMRVVFPEADEIKILAAAKTVYNDGIALPVLIGDGDSIRALANSEHIAMDGIEIMTQTDYDTDRMREALSAYGLASMAKKYVRNPLYYGALLVREGKADAMVAGLRYDTAEVIMASQIVIGMAEGIQTPSSIFLMNIPRYEESEGSLLIFADGGVCVDPTAGQLADITITTADTAKRLLGWEPRIAMLSYSTKGSAAGPSVEKMLAAMNMVKERQPSLKIDGEFQLDAAIVPSIAAKKVKEDSPVAGKANILIFPDLNAGNICYKAVQRLAGADAYGPFLQGFAKTVSDLSRGSTVEDIIGVTTMAVVAAQN